MGAINDATTDTIAPPMIPTVETPLIHAVAKKQPRPDAKSYAEIKADIAKHGQKMPIVRYKGQIVDGITRQKICMELGIEPKYIDLEGDRTDEQLEALSQSLNVHRRHLSRGQKDVLISVALVRDPELSDRAIAKGLNVSHHTVAAKRREQVSTGQLPSSKQRKGLDNKKRKAPSSKAASSKTDSMPHLTADEIVALGTPENRAVAEDHAWEIAKLSPNTLEPEEAATPKTPAPFDPYKNLALRLNGAMDTMNRAIQEAREKEEVSLSSTEEKLFTEAIINLETLVRYLGAHGPNSATRIGGEPSESLSVPGDGVDHHPLAQQQRAELASHKFPTKRDCDASPAYQIEVLGQCPSLPKPNKVSITTSRESSPCPGNPSDQMGSQRRVR